MQILRDQAAVQAAIDTWPDTSMCQLIAERLAFCAEDEALDLSEMLKVILIEPGDTLEELDAEFSGAFLINPYSGRRLGDDGFCPFFETLEEYSSFYEMFFCIGDAGVAVLVPMTAGIDHRLLQMCAQFATEAPRAST